MTNKQITQLLITLCLFFFALWGQTYIKQSPSSSAAIPFLPSSLVTPPSHSHLAHALVADHDDLPPNDLVINEIDYDQRGNENAEFIEIKNIHNAPVNLDDYKIHLVNGQSGGANIYQMIDMPDETLAAGDYFVICTNVIAVENCDFPLSIGANFIENGAPDAVALILDNQIIDTVSYEGNTGAPYTEGSGEGLVDDASHERVGISRYPDGLDTDRNNGDFSLRCISPGYGNVAPISNCLTITPTFTPATTPTDEPVTVPPTTPPPPTAESTFTPSPTPTPSLTPTATNTPSSGSDGPVSVHLPLITIPFAREPNDNPSQANGPIPSGPWVHSDFTPGDGRNDYFYFEMVYPYTIYARLTYIPSGHDYDLIIRDASLDIVDCDEMVDCGYSAEHGTTDEEILTTIQFPGRYYIQVHNPSGKSSNEQYHLQVIYVWP